MRISDWSSDVCSSDLSKPFAFSELHARLEALLRRPRAIAQHTQLQVEDLVMDLLTRRVTRAGRPIDLRPQEFKLLEYLMRHAGEVVTRTLLFAGVWAFPFRSEERRVGKEGSVRVYLGGLR